MTADLPRWREALRSRLKDAHVPPELTEEVMCYQQSQLLSTPQFIVQLPQILALLHRLHSPYAAQAKQLTESNSTFTPALHTLFFATLAVKSGRAGHHVKPAITGRRARTVAE